MNLHFNKFALLLTAQAVIYHQEADAAEATINKEDFDFGGENRLNLGINPDRHDILVDTLLNNDVRSLEGDIPCNTVLGVYPVADIQTTLTLVFQYEFFNRSLSTIEEIPPLIAEKIPTLEHDVAVMKVCASCESEELTGYGCETTDYGYNTTHSGTLLLPVDITNPETGDFSIIDTEELKTWIEMRSIAIVQKENDFILSTIPPSIPPFMGVPTSFGARTMEYALYAASMGLVSIAPHKMGFGESNKATPPLLPSALDKKAIVTSTLPLYEKAKELVTAFSDGMTTLGTDAYIMGYSEGGYSAVAAADGFEKHGFTLLKVMAGGAPLRPRSGTLLGALRSLSLSQPPDNIRLVLVLTVIGILFSDQRPGVANYEQNQPFLNSTVSPAYAQMFMDEATPSPLLDGSGAFFAFLAANYPVIIANLENFLSSNVLNFFGTALAIGDTDPCVNNPLSTLVAAGVDKLCKALDDNDLANVVIEAKYDIELCWGEADELVSTASIPDGVEVKYFLEGVDHNFAHAECLVKFLYGTTIEKPVMKTPKPTKAPKSPKSPKLPKGRKLRNVVA